MSEQKHTPGPEFKVMGNRGGDCRHADTLEEAELIRHEMRYENSWQYRNLPKFGGSFNGAVRDYLCQIIPLTPAASAAIAKAEGKQ